MSDDSTLTLTGGVPRDRLAGAETKAETKAPPKPAAAAEPAVQANPTPPAAAPAARPAAAPKQRSEWSAGGYMRAGLFFVLILGGGLGGWSAFAKLSGAVIAPGTLRVEAQRQVVQHVDGGVVGEIMVSEGAVVDAGDVLLRLDGSALRSELAVLESQLYEIMARRGRLEAEQADGGEITFDAELLEVAGERPEVASLIDGQRSLFTARASTLEREVEVLGERQAQLRQQIDGTEAELEALENQAALIEQELDGQQSLFDQGLARVDRVLALQREAARIDGQRGQLRSQIARLGGQISEIEIERLRLDAGRREEAISEMREIGFRELELKERRIAILERLSRLDLKAPLGGVVYDQSVFAIGAVIRPAEPVAFIVPNDSDLVVDAQVDPINIDLVRPTQDATIRFPALNTRTTPELTGQVRLVTADILTEEQTGRTYYMAEVTLSEEELVKLEDQELVPGMPAEVYIETGERTPINYLMKPLADYFNRALRED